MTSTVDEFVEQRSLRFEILLVKYIFSMCKLKNVGIFDFLKVCFRKKNQNFKVRFVIGEKIRTTDFFQFWKICILTIGRPF